VVEPSNAAAEGVDTSALLSTDSGRYYDAHVGGSMKAALKTLLAAYSVQTHQLHSLDRDSVLHELHVGSEMMPKSLQTAVHTLMSRHHRSLT
jgi:hypothetical protein